MIVTCWHHITARKTPIAATQFPLGRNNSAFAVASDQRRRETARLAQFGL